MKKLIYLFAITFIIISCSSDSSEDSGGPTANDDSLIVNENSGSGEANQIDVTLNDNIGPNGGDSNNYNLASPPSDGSVNEVSDGVFEYIPNPGFFGSDSFTYRIADKDGNDDTAVVDVTVSEVPGPTAEDFLNMDPNFPSFVSIDDTTPVDKKWVKVDALSDEFNGTLDIGTTPYDYTKKWFFSNWNYGNTPVSMGNNFFTENGNLCIKATLGNDPLWFKTARVHSTTKISYPMYTECSMKTAHISAFNTFWMNNGDINDRDEIDIVENNSKPTQACINTAMNTPNFPWTTHLFPTQMNSQYFIAKNGVTERHEDNYDTRWLLPENPKKDKTWNEDYHIVGCWWIDARTVQFYLDGEPAGRVTTNQDFTRELELIFDLWTADECFLGGLADKNDLSDDSVNTMRIDWVRTWKLETK